MIDSVHLESISDKETTKKIEKRGGEKSTTVPRLCPVTSQSTVINYPDNAIFNHSNRVLSLEEKYLFGGKPW